MVRMLTGLSLVAVLLFVTGPAVAELRRAEADSPRDRAQVARHDFYAGYGARGVGRYGRYDDVGRVGRRLDASAHRSLDGVVVERQVQRTRGLERERVLIERPTAERVHPDSRVRVVRNPRYESHQEAVLGRVRELREQRERLRRQPEEMRAAGRTAREAQRELAELRDRDSRDRFSGDEHSPTVDAYAYRRYHRDRDHHDWRDDWRDDHWRDDDHRYRYRFHHRDRYDDFYGRHRYHDFYDRGWRGHYGWSYREHWPGGSVRFYHRYKAPLRYYRCEPVYPYPRFYRDSGLTIWLHFD